VSVKLLKDMVAAEHQRGATILFSTHIMAHAEELCEHVVMIHNGRKVLDEPMVGLRRQFDPRVIRVEPLHENQPLAVLEHVPGVASVKTTPDGCEVQLQPGIDPTTAMQQISATVPVASIALARLRLEDVFLRLVAGEGQDTEAERALRANLQGVGVEGALA
jgi:ABC-2 type transport system ATP-binding protein